jgi:hypothetical protein
MALYKGFVETSVAGGAVRRTLLDLDLSVLAPSLGLPPQPQIVNAVDVDGVSPRPDLNVWVTIHTSGQTDTHLEIHLAPFDGRELIESTVRVFFNTDTVPGQLIPPVLYPVTGTFPNPSHWVYLAYKGQPGQRMPELTFHLSQRAFPAKGAAAGAPLARDDVDIIVTSPEVVGPLDVEGGLIEGPLVLQQAREPLAGPAYADGPLLDVRAITAEGAPVATTAAITVTTPSSPTFPLECFWVGLGSDHLIDPPPAPAATVTGAAGAVDPGTHRYKVSYVLANGNETKTSPPSAPVTIAGPSGGRVDVSLPIGPPPPAPPATPDPGLAVVGRRVYRTTASATGDDGEYLRVTEVLNNTGTTFPDNVADSALVDPPADRLVVHYSSRLRHDLTGLITLRDGGTEDVFDASITNAPTEARVKYLLRPPANRPRVRWQADTETAHVEVRLPRLASGSYTWGEARADGVPAALGAHWFVRGANQMLVEVGGGQRGQPVIGAIGRVQVVLASAERPWRDAPQAVVLELVDQWFAPGRPDKARARIAAQRLRRALFDLGRTEGAPAVHARTGEGFVVDAELDSVPAGPLTARFPSRPVRPLRALQRSITFDAAGARSASHASVRVGDLPDRLRLDLRASPATAAGGEYLGARLQGLVHRVKVLSLGEPSAAAPAWAADALRVWATVPTGHDVVDVVRTPAETSLTTEPLAAEVSVRHPGGLSTGADEPFRHVKGAFAGVGNVVIAAPAVAFGVADAGSDATTLRDADVLLNPVWTGGSVRYLTGALAGARRPITSVAADGASATTEDFGAAPAAGNQYVIEAPVPAFGGLSLTTPLDGSGVSGRVALSKDLDRLVAAGATPQVRLRTAPVGDGSAPTLRAVSARVYGVRALGMASDPAGPLSVPVLLDPNRVNKALRAELRELDERFAPDERDMVKGRLEVLPDDPALRVDLAGSQFEWRAATRSGPVVFWSEPGLMRGADAGPRASTPAGIGLVEGQVDGLPRWVRLTVLPSTAVPPAELAPGNLTPLPSGFAATGFRAEVSEMASVDFLRMITWGRDHRDDLNQIFWGYVRATFVRWNQESPPAAPAPPVLTPLWIWMLGEPDPADENAPGAGLGFTITPPSGGGPLGVDVTLDIDQYSVTTNQAFVRWNALPTFDLRQELQMSSYAGSQTLSSTAGGVVSGGSDSTGRWFLRLIDGRPWYVGFGSAYFGNTGVGSPFTLPRIFT